MSYSVPVISCHPNIPFSNLSLNCSTEYALYYKDLTKTHLNSATLPFITIYRQESKSVWVFILGNDNKTFDDTIVFNGKAYKPDKIMKVVEWCHEEKNEVGLTTLDADEIVEFVEMKKDAVEVLSKKVSAKTCKQHLTKKKRTCRNKTLISDSCHPHRVKEPI